MTKAIRVAIAIPSAGHASIFFAHSLAALVGYGNSLAARPDSETLEITWFVQCSSVIHQNRENLIRNAQEWKATHILFLDDDMIFDPRVLSILLGRRQAYVGCNYPKKGDPIVFTAINAAGTGHIVTRAESTGLEETSYIGFGVCLIEMHVFDKVPAPRFLPIWVPEAGLYSTEDAPFCKKVREAGIAVYMDHDASKLIGHHGQKTYHWHEWKPAATQAVGDQSANVVPIAAGAKS